VAMDATTLQNRGDLAAEELIVASGCEERSRLHDQRREAEADGSFHHFRHPRRARGCAPEAKAPPPSKRLARSFTLFDGKVTSKASQASNLGLR
jgi:hypothetical protein